MRTDVLIVGAGPAGLVLAVVLAEHGVNFQIIDRKTGPVAESRATIVHVRTLELLHRLHLAGRALAGTLPTTDDTLPTMLSDSVPPSSAPRTPLSSAS